MTKNSLFWVVGLLIVVLLTVSAATLFGSSWRAQARAHDYAAFFSLSELERSDEPELRIWTVQGESGVITGYIVRSGEVRLYDPRAGGPRVVRTIAAADIIRQLPRLRRVRLGRCEVVLDGGTVVVEGADRHGKFAFEIEGDCEGWNLHVVDYVLNTLCEADVTPS